MSNRAKSNNAGKKNDAIEILGEITRNVDKKLNLKTKS